MSGLSSVKVTTECLLTPGAKGGSSKVTDVRLDEWKYAVAGTETWMGNFTNSDFSRTKRGRVSSGIIGSTIFVGGLDNELTTTVAVFASMFVESNAEFAVDDIPGNINYSEISADRKIETLNWIN